MQTQPSMTPTPRNSDNGARRLLVITFHFPPDGSVGGLRWAGVSKYLARRGWEVHVITASAGGDERSEPGLVVHHLAPHRTLNDLYNSLARQVRTFGHTRQTGQNAPNSGGEATVQPSSTATVRGVMGWVRANLSVAMAFPDYGRGWVFRVARKARSLLREQQFDAVISSGPPHSAHLAATAACRHNSRLLWIDMRDPWAALTDGIWLQAADTSAATRAMIRRLERLVFRRARGIITNTAEFGSDVRKRYPGLPVSYISNGVDPERLPPAPASKFDGLSIAYAGSLYLSRDLSPVVRAMRGFLARYPQARAAIKLRVAGGMDSSLEARFRTEVATADLEDRVEVRGRVSGPEAMDMINRSHLTVVLAQDQPAQIPAKLYECVAMGVQTLVISEATSAAAREARRLGAVALESSDIEGMSRLIEAVWLDRGARMIPLAAFSYSDIAGQMDALLRDNMVVGSHSGFVGTAAAGLDSSSTR